MVLLFALAGGTPAMAASGTCVGAQPGAGEVQAAGNVIYSQGVVEAQSVGGTRPLAKGGAVCVGDTVVTSPSGRVQIRMADGGLIGVRPGTMMKIEDFQFNGKEDGTERSTIALLGGGFRALTGMIGHTHKENYRITTPTAIIGIRGTDHEPMYVPAGAPGQAEPGTYDKVNSGGVVITTQQGAVEVSPNQVGFAPDVQHAPPVILRDMPSFYHAGRGAEQAGFGEAGSRGGRDAGREPREHTHNSDRHQGRDLRAPEPHERDMKGPEMHAPEMHESDY